MDGTAFPDLAFMINADTRIDDRVITDHRIVTDEHVGIDLHIVPDHHILSYVSKSSYVNILAQPGGFGNVRGLFDALEIIFELIVRIKQFKNNLKRSEEK